MSRSSLIVFDLYPKYGLELLHTTRKKNSKFFLQPSLSIYYTNVYFRERKKHLKVVVIYRRRHVIVGATFLHVCLLL